MQRLRSTVGRRIRRRGGTDYPDVQLNDAAANSRHGFPTNNITTTKYTPLTFIPKNLFEQFRRVTNIYFLSIVIITLIPAISPLSPYTSILPLAFVLGVTALKEGYEDFLRYRADRAVNNRTFDIIRGGTEKKRASRDVVVGDIVILYSDDVVPADIVVLATSNADGSCFVETAQLDGETNLKPRNAARPTYKLDKAALSTIKGKIHTEKPTHDLYTWSGTITVDGGETPLDIDNLLLRGMNIRNTDWVIGVVLYTGRLSKLSLNQKTPPSKFSTTERRLNKCVIGIFVFKMVCVIVVTSLAGYFNGHDAKEAWYLDYGGLSASYQTVKNFFMYFVLLSFLIPISLMVTLEVVKVCQGALMDWDEKMALDPKNTEETGMKAKTSNLNDELALVQYVFSDKTGTLTENCMIFRQCSINGTAYLRAGDAELREELERGSENSPAIREFLVNMAVCHAVETPESDSDGKLLFKAQSPDEKALCEGAETNGYVFFNRVPKVGLSFRDHTGADIFMETPILFEFTSDRRRMSVMTKLPGSDGYRLYSKGADAVMLELLAPGNDALVAKTKDDIEQFSREGLRTLILAYRDFTNEEFEAEFAKYNAAVCLLGDARKEAVEVVAKSLECNLQLIGCTAIEDRLQQEVPETIHNLLRAGIRVWVITGDKQETAINIGYSCRLLKKGMTVLTINAKDDQDCNEKLRALVASYCDKPLTEELGMVIDGHTLKFALDTQSELFLKIAILCHSVVCCRVTPIQKATVVALVKKHTKCVALAIGDGANDVSMIQEAQIGVGIFGKEGTQAARSADYAIREFRWSFVRNSKMIQYFFYKNCSVFLVQFWFAFYCGYSGQTIYDPWIITLFNILFTSIPPFVFALTEKDIGQDLIEEYPEAYRTVQTGNHLTYASVLGWQLLAIFHSLVFFYGTVFLVGQEPFNEQGHTTGLVVMGNYMSSIAINTVVLKILSETHSWNVFTVLGAIFSISVYWLVLLVESFIPSTLPEQYNQFVIVVGNPNFWALFLWTLIVCLLPDIMVSYVRRQFIPEDWMILQEAKKYKRNLKSVKDVQVN